MKYFVLDAVKEETINYQSQENMKMFSLKSLTLSPLKKKCIKILFLRNLVKQLKPNMVSVFLEVDSSKCLTFNHVLNRNPRWLPPGDIIIKQHY
jgi:hypothetical protein